MHREFLPEIGVIAHLDEGDCGHGDCEQRPKKLKELQWPLASK